MNDFRLLNDKNLSKSCDKKAQDALCKLVKLQGEYNSLIKAIIKDFFKLEEKVK